MKLSRPDLAAYALAALGIVCLTALLMIGRTVPEYFPMIVFTIIGAGGGIALNTPQGSETITTSSTARRQAPAPDPAPRVPAQRPAPAPAAPQTAPSNLGPAVTSGGLV